jgi:subtilisin family serine protease
MSDGTAAAPDENNDWYIDKASGRRRSFTRQAGEAVVTLVPRPPDDVVERLVGNTAVRSISAGANLRRGYASIHIDAPVSEIMAVPEVADALAVMVDEDGHKRYFLPGQLTVQFRAGVDQALAEAVIRDLGSDVVVRQRTPGYFTIAVPPQQDLFSAIRAFSERPEVAFAEPSEVGFNDALYDPGDPDFSLLWGMRNTGQVVNGSTGTAGIDIDAVRAWDLERGDHSVIVAVIDTGADLDHADLLANILPRGAEDWDFADTGDPSPDDAEGHGTHVAGTAAAVDNAVGVVGVAHLCAIMPLRIDLRAGMNQNRADAINYVAHRAASETGRRFVINCSWRMSGDHTGVRTAIENATSSNVVVVFAAGNAANNTDTTPEYPGVYPQVMAVAAIDQDGRKAWFSNYGTNVDVSAPGVNIYSSLPDDVHGYLDGTSMASPHVAGLAALVWSAVPALSNTEVRQVIEETADSVDAVNPGYGGLLGHGCVNAFHAVELAQFMGGYLPSLPALL